jgi:hypothetical protein
MAIGLVKGRSSVFIVEETTEGTYAPPASAADAVEVLEDFTGYEYTREEIERNVLSDTIESEASRPGLPTVTGEIPTEFKAGITEGAAPRANTLIESVMGGKRNAATEGTLLAGSTATVLNVNDADLAKFAAGDCVLVKVAGAHKVRPIASKNPGTGNDDGSLVLAITLGAAPAAGVKIAPVTTYFHDNAAPSFSVTTYLGGEIEDQAVGVRALSMEIGNWTTGQIPTATFSTEGLDLSRAVDTPAFSPDFSTEPLPPVLLNACAYINGVELDYSEFSLTVENTKSDILSVCKPSGKAGSRYTNFAVTGSINPYMQDNAVDRFTAFNQNDDISLFVFASNPKSTAGEIENVVAIWIPQAKITGLTNGDADGILTDQIEFKSYRKNGNDSLFLSFI